MANIEAAHSVNFRIPRADFSIKNACSVDFGGSVIKMTYAVDEGDHISVSCVSFMQDKIEDALKFLVFHAPKALKDVQKIDTCGIGCHIHEPVIQRILGVGVQNHSEFQCFVEGFRCLSSNLSHQELFFPKSDAVQEYLDGYTECLRTAEALFNGPFKSKLEIWKFSDTTKNDFSDSSSSSDEDADDLQRVLKQQKRRMRKTKRRIQRNERRQKRQEWLESIKNDPDGSSVDAPNSTGNDADGAKEVASKSNVRDEASPKHKAVDIPYINATYTMPPPEVPTRKLPLDMAMEEKPTGAQLNDVQYPVLLLMCGSGGAPILIRDDGVYNILDINTICGRFFLGMGSLLTGAKNFKDLISLAEKGDSEAVNVGAKHMKQEGVADFYSIFPGEMVVYGMGHTVGKDISDFKKEDLAAAVLTTVTISLAQTFQIWSMVLGIKSVYFCGSFPTSSQLIRDEISKAFSARVIANPFGKATEHHFLRCGSYLGCLGAMFTTMKGDTKK